MIAQLKKLVRNVYENTGIEVSVFSQEGKCLLGNGDLRPPAGVDGILPDKAAGMTWFRTLGPEGYVCGIKGVGEVQKNYAFLLSDLVEGAAGRAANLPKGESLRRILLGECAAADIRKFRARYSVPEGPCFALAVEAEGKLSDVITLLAQYAESGADCAIALAGHRGPECEAAFARLERALRDRGRRDILVDSPDRLPARLPNHPHREALVVPLLMSLGHHARHDVLEDLARTLSAQTWPHSLAELPAIRALVVDHARKELP